MKKIYISGIGGSGAYYLAKYYQLQGFKVQGSDLIENDRTLELEKLGIKITYSPQNTEHIESIEPIDTYIYSHALPENHIELSFFKDKVVERYEVGELFDTLTKRYRDNRMNETEKKAFIESNIAPLFLFNWNSKKFIAVTGTDGKTTTCSMIYHIFKNLNLKVGMITTLGITVNGKELDTGLHTTTPSSQEIFEILNSSDFADVDYVVIETTSHGLAMGRLAGASFDVAVITNITSEHLDYHKTWENYFNAKARIFTEYLKPEGKLVLNLFDPSFVKLSILAEQVNVTYFAKKYEGIELNESLNTEYNIQNATSALNVIDVLIPERLNDAKDTLKLFTGVKGRMEIMQTRPFEIIVDFAHTANALESVLRNLKEKLKSGGKLRVVFGCAGKRDVKKRFTMGEASVKYADVIYLAPEDPRTESLKDINREVLNGMGFTKVEIEEIAKKDFDEARLKNGKVVKVFQKGELSDRFDAIQSAIEDCQENDILVICGKGHEKSMCFGTTEYYWSDQEAVKSIMND
jgi:UDP-N-acetylmuramoyl-L-alanyl-D-glutamate--2,6-diaminopimelate ligase